MLIADLKEREIILQDEEQQLLRGENRGDLIKLMLETYVTEFPRPDAVAKTWSPIGGKYAIKVPQVEEEFEIWWEAED